MVKTHVITLELVFFRNFLFSFLYTVFYTVFIQFSDGFSASDLFEKKNRKSVGSWLSNGVFG